MGDRKTFVFNTDWREVLRDYPAEVRLEVYEAIIDYIATGTYSELKPLSNMAFKFIKRELDYNTERYNEVVAKRREAGLAGAQARQAKQANAKNAEQKQAKQANAKNAEQKQAKQANANFAKTDLAKQDDIVYDNDIVTSNVSNTLNAHTRKSDYLKFVLPEYQEAFTKWLNYKKERKESYKGKESAKECYNKLVALSGNNPATAMAIVNQSMANNWAGLFELKQKLNNGNNTSQDRKHFGTSEGISFTPRADIEI